MNSNERREKLLHILRTTDKPIKGIDLSKELNVTRQIVVKDIALLRASGNDILSTSNGYIIYTAKSKKQEFKIKCKNPFNSLMCICLNNILFKLPFLLTPYTQYIFFRAFDALILLPNLCLN